MKKQISLSLLSSFQLSLNNDWNVKYNPTKPNNIVITVIGPAVKYPKIANAVIKDR